MHFIFIDHVHAARAHIHLYKIDIFGLYNNIHWGRCHGGQFVHSAHLGNNDGGFAKHDAMGGIKSVSYTHLTLPTNREV